MSIPSEVVGAGNGSAAVNVLKIKFSEATSDIPKLEAWDDENFNTVANEIFAGTSGNINKPMLSAVATTDGAPASSWKPASATAGGATINRLKGSTNYVNLDNAPVIQNGEVKANLCWEVPYDASVPANMNCVFVVRYSYAGAAPILTWYFNDKVGGGTEGTPVWTQITSGLTGNKLKPADAGCSSSNIVLHKPVSGTLDNPALWVTI